MGEYAKYEGHEIKIGTCEDMYYLRFSQAHLVEPMPNNVDPVNEAEALRFRFPFPDEDDVKPGHFPNHDRGILCPVEVPTDIDHAASCSRPTHGVLIKQQRLVDGHLLTICQCGGCNVEYRLSNLADALPVIKSCQRQGKKFQATETGPGDWRWAAFFSQMAERIAAGYTTKVTRRSAKLTAEAAVSAASPVVISSYSRQQAIEDGVLHDVTEWASDKSGILGGYKCPVAVTASLWAAIEAIPQARKGKADVRGRTHDVLALSLLALGPAVRQRGRNDATYQVVLPTAGTRKRVRVLRVVADGNGVTIGFPKDF